MQLDPRTVYNDGRIEIEMVRFIIKMSAHFRSIYNCLSLSNKIFIRSQDL